MALPLMSTVEQASSFARTVEPFLPELYALPERLVASCTSLNGLYQFYMDSNPFILGLGASIVLAAVFLISSEIMRNYSQVDCMWSLLPTIYNAHFVLWSHLHGLQTDRLYLVLLWSVIWSIRLTYNYWRKGGYNYGSEDYRWAIVQKNVHPILFFLLNLTFISFIQSVLLYLISAPTYVMFLASQVKPEIEPADLAFTAVELGLITIEWFSDQQQWDYQNAKKQYQKTAKVPQGYTQEEMDRGFITSGLWSLVRHPNFAAEQAIWCMLYQWSCFTTRSLYSWAGAGCLTLLLLFQGSTKLTELITGGKYPDYRDYQKKVNMFFPGTEPYQAQSPAEAAKKEN